MCIRDRGWIVVCGNTLTLTRLWQSCLATDTAENSVLQLLSDVECHLMLSMTRNLFSFFIPDPVPRAGIPNSSDPPKRVWPPLTALSWGLSIHPMVSLRWIFSRLQSSYGTVCPSHTAQSLGNCGPPGMKHCPPRQSPWLWFYSHSFGAVGWVGGNITPSVPWDAQQVTRSICRSHVKGTAKTTQAGGSVVWRWLRLKVLDPQFPLMLIE